MQRAVEEKKKKKNNSNNNNKQLVVGEGAMFKTGPGSARFSG